MVPCPQCQFPNFVPSRVGPFTLFEPVGAGGVASAYKAWRQDQGKRLFVVKLLHRDRASEADEVAAFVAEGEIHSQVSHHPNLPDYGGHGVEGAQHYYAAEYIDGERLKHRLARMEKLPPEEALAIASDLLSAFQHILESGFLYRDVNIGNVILRPNGSAVLVDFGLTEPIEVAAERKQQAFVDCAAPFLPPERVRRAGETESSIVYSLGLLLYRMLTGGDYVKASTLTQTALRHIGPRLAITATQMPGCSDDVVALVVRMTKVDPAQRFQTFKETKEAVDAILAKKNR